MTVPRDVARGPVVSILRVPHILVTKLLMADWPPPRRLQERVHIDQTYEATIKRVHQLLGADAPRLLQSRVRLINVWRPIAHPVFHRPLAVSDWRTLDTEHDLVPVRFIYPDREGGECSSYRLKFGKRLTRDNRHLQREVQPGPPLVLLVRTDSR